MLTSQEHHFENENVKTLLKIPIEKFSNLDVVVRGKYQTKR